MSDEREETAKRLRKLAQQTDDDEQAELLMDAAAEYEQQSLNGAAYARESA